MTSTALMYFEMPAKNTDNLVPVVLHPAKPLDWKNGGIYSINGSGLAKIHNNIHVDVNYVRPWLSEVDN